MTEFSVSKEAFVFLCSALSGVVIFFVYDLFRLLRKKSGAGTFFVHIQDGMFWLIAFLIMFFVVFFVNNGILRMYEILGASLGALIYGFALSGWVLKLLEKMVDLFSRIFKFFLKILLTPLYFAYNILYRYICLLLRPVMRFGRFATVRLAEGLKRSGRMIKKK